MCSIVKERPILPSQDGQIPSYLASFFKELKARNDLYRSRSIKSDGALDSLIENIKQNVAVTRSFIQHILAQDNADVSTIHENFANIQHVVTKQLSVNILAVVDAGSVSVSSMSEKYMVNLYTQIQKKSAGVDKTIEISSSATNDHEDCVHERYKVREQCAICQTPIEFEDLSMSICQGGHQFSKL